MSILTERILHDTQQDAYQIVTKNNTASWPWIARIFSDAVRRAPHLNTCMLGQAFMIAKNGHIWTVSYYIRTDLIQKFSSTACTFTICIFSRIVWHSKIYSEIHFAKRIQNSEAVNGSHCSYKQTEIRILWWIDSVYSSLFNMPSEVFFWHNFKQKMFKAIFDILDSVYWTRCGRIIALSICVSSLCGHSIPREMLSTIKRNCSSRFHSQHKYIFSVETRWYWAKSFGSVCSSI